MTVPCPARASALDVRARPSAITTVGGEPAKSFPQRVQLPLEAPRRPLLPLRQVVRGQAGARPKRDRRDRAAALAPRSARRRRDAWKHVLQHRHDIVVLGVDRGAGLVADRDREDRRVAMVQQRESRPGSPRTVCPSGRARAVSALPRGPGCHGCVCRRSRGRQARQPERVPSSLLQPLDDPLVLQPRVGQHQQLDRGFVRIHARVSGDRGDDCASPGQGRRASSSRAALAPWTTTTGRASRRDRPRCPSRLMPAPPPIFRTNHAQHLQARRCRSGVQPLPPGTARSRSRAASPPA